MRKAFDDFAHRRKLTTTAMEDPPSAAASSQLKPPSRPASRASVVGPRLKTRRLSQVGPLAPGVSAEEDLELGARPNAMYHVTDGRHLPNVLSATPSFRSTVPLESGEYKVIFAQRPLGSPISGQVGQVGQVDHPAWVFNQGSFYLDPALRDIWPTTFDKTLTNYLGSRHRIGTDFIDQANNERLIHKALSWTSVEPARPTIIAMTGPAGTGKTQLLAGCGSRHPSLASRYLSRAFEGGGVGVLSVIEVSVDRVVSDLLSQPNGKHGRHIDLTISTSDPVGWSTDSTWYHSTEDDLQGLLQQALGRASRSARDDRDWRSLSTVVVMIGSIGSIGLLVHDTVQCPFKFWQSRMEQNGWKNATPGKPYRSCGIKFWSYGQMIYTGVVMLDGPGFDRTGNKDAKTTKVILAANQIEETVIKPMFYATSVMGTQTELVRVIDGARSTVGKILWPYLISRPRVMIIALLSPHRQWIDIDLSLRTITSVNLTTTPPRAPIDATATRPPSRANALTSRPTGDASSSHLPRPVSDADKALSETALRDLEAEIKVLRAENMKLRERLRRYEV
ncbi:hypothetical protein IAU60_006913 [Kwoniella sp. DSM 27419]